MIDRASRFVAACTCGPLSEDLIAQAIQIAVARTHRRALNWFSDGWLGSKTFCSVRSHYGMVGISQLATRPIWENFMGDRALAPGEINMLLTYDALSSNYQQVYLKGLSERQRLFGEKYRLPLLPARFLEKRGLLKSRDIAAAHRRKDQSDVILPLFPLLVEIAQLRKQVAERLIREFRKHRDRVLAGEIALPYQFQYADRQFSIPEDAPTISAIELKEQEIILSFTLWDRVSWAQTSAVRPVAILPSNQPSRQSTSPKP